MKPVPLQNTGLDKKHRKATAERKKVIAERKREMLFRLDEQYEQEKIHQAGKEADSRKRILKSKLDNICRHGLKEEQEKNPDWTEKQKAELAQLEVKEKLLQRKTFSVQRV